MFLNPFTKSGGDPHVLAVSMTGVKLGDRVAFIGAARPGRIAAIAAKRRPLATYSGAAR